MFQQLCLLWASIYIIMAIIFMILRLQLPFVIFIPVLLNLWNIIFSRPYDAGYLFLTAQKENTQNYNQVAAKSCKVFITFIRETLSYCCVWKFNVGTYLCTYVLPIPGPLNSTKFITRRSVVKWDINKPSIHHTCKAIYELMVEKKLF